MIPERLRRMIERYLPWYDPEAEAEHDARSQAIAQRSVRARRYASTVRAAYIQAADELRR